MSSKIFKNYQVNVGMPIEIRAPLNFDTIKKVEEIEVAKETEENSTSTLLVSEEIIQKAREEADLILREAEYEAARILQEAMDEAYTNRNSIEEEARQAGFEKGYTEVQSQYEGMIQEAEEIREHARSEYEEVLAGMESQIVDIILQIARKVIGVEISNNKESILYLIKQAFEKCANKDNVVLKVSPGDYEYVSENHDRLISMIEGVGELEVKRDPASKEGACIIETPYGNVDAGVNTKLKMIEEAFEEVVGK